MEGKELQDKRAENVKRQEALTMAKLAGFKPTGKVNVSSAIEMGIASFGGMEEFFAFLAANAKASPGSPTAMRACALMLDLLQSDKLAQSADGALGDLSDDEVLDRARKILNSSPAAA